MDPKMFYALLIAWIIPIFCGWLTKVGMKSIYKFLVTLALSAVLGIGTVLINVYVGDATWQWADLSLYLMIVGEAEVMYRLIIKSIPGATDWLARTGPVT